MIFKNVTFKEWSAWVMIAALTLGSVLYFGLLRAVYVETGAKIPPAVPFIIFTVIVVIVSIVGHIVAALANLKTANEASDERDRAIRIFASHWSGLVLGFCVVTALVTYVFLPDGQLLFHVIFSGLVLSQILEFVLQIIAYRRSSASLAHFQDD